ncbi:MAG: hypothetical protein FJY20_02120 [Bacteroidetes bacterium]|nr:hypothetical protein [Bacteroidota bacterium]
MQLPNNIKQFRHLRTLILLLALAITGDGRLQAQTCPPNIDFETGTYNNWTCYTGRVAAVNNTNSISLVPSGPQANQHTLY